MPLFRLTRLFNFRPRKPAASVMQRADQRLLDQMTQGIAYFLGESEESAAAMAESALEKRRQLRTGEAAPASARLVTTTRAAIDAALAHGPCLLALPCHAEALSLLAALVRDDSLRLVLVDSPAARSLTDEVLAGRSIARCPTQDLVKRVKFPSGDDGQAVYISFPELHALIPGTTASAMFLGKACRVSVLEPLLCVSGLNTLLTLGVSPDAPGSLAVASWNAAAFRAEKHSKPIGIALGWLWSHLQAVASGAPSELLSWQALYRATAHCYQIERENQIKQLEAYFNAWKRSPAALPGETHDFALARLAAMHDNHPSGAAA